MSTENYSKRNNNTHKEIQIYHKKPTHKLEKDLKSFKIDTDKYKDNTIRFKKRIYL
ncbi:MAG: hypothetical protein FWH29_04945 [Methanobrevibacter sp.]|nr:hypothetical protein [Methanobrevibacter sp.]